MSVIVKNMEMPVMCSYCKFREPFIDYAYCHLAEMDMEYEESDNCRHPNCPLIELPPHGRLIDVDEPMTKISTMMQEPDYQHEGEGWMVGLIMARDAIDEAPTVIESEGETDGR